MANDKVLLGPNLQNVNLPNAELLQLVTLFDLSDIKLSITSKKISLRLGIRSLRKFLREMSRAGNFEEAIPEDHSIYKRNDIELPSIEVEMNLPTESVQMRIAVFNGIWSLGLGNVIKANTPFYQFIMAYFTFALKES